MKKILFTLLFCVFTASAFAQSVPSNSYNPRYVRFMAGDSGQNARVVLDTGFAPLSAIVGGSNAASTYIGGQSTSSAWSAIALTTKDTSTTGQTLIGTPLQFTVGANQVWAFEVAFADSSSSGAGIEYGITAPSGATFISVGGGQTTGPTAWSADVLTASATAGVATATAATGATYAEYQTQGTITTGATAGAVIFDFLKVTSGKAIIKAGAYITAYRIQ